MPIKEGILCKRPSGRWAICWPGFAPVEMGQEFLVEVDGSLRVTRMEFWHHGCPLRGREYKANNWHRHLAWGISAARTVQSKFP
jgi:hypothetical protein